LLFSGYSLAQIITTFPYEESFESGGPDNTTELPSDWTILNDGTDSPLNPGFVMSSERPHTGARTVIVSGVPSVFVQAWIITPEIKFEKGETYAIKISYRTGDDGGAAAAIGIADMPNSADIGQNLLWDISSVDNTEYNEVEISYTHLGDNTQYIGLVVNSFGGRHTQNIFDTFSIEKKTLSNQEFEKDLFRIVQNPISDFFELELKKTTNNTSLTIYDSLGKQIMREEKLTLYNLINVSHISGGFYFARIEDNSGRSLVKKIIIK